MKITNLIYLFAFVVSVSSCLNNEESTRISESCPAQTHMSDGEIVSYSIEYANGNVEYHTISEIPDGIDSDLIVYNISSKKESTYNLKYLCPNIDSMYTKEESFILLGTSLSNLLDDSTFSSTVIDYTKQSCYEEIVTVPAGEFPAEVCSYVGNNSSESFDAYNYMQQNGSIPMRGLLKYIWRDSNQEITILLTDWNGL